MPLLNDPRVILKDTPLSYSIMMSASMCCFKNCTREPIASLNGICRQHFRKYIHKNGKGTAADMEDDNEKLTFSDFYGQTYCMTVRKWKRTVDYWGSDKMSLTAFGSKDTYYQLYIKDDKSNK